jgi:hypothetical protein
VEQDEVALFTASIESIVEGSAPGELAAALMEFGWDELLDEAPDVAVHCLFEAQGSHLAGTTMLDRVVSGAGREAAPGDVAVVYPPLAASANGRAGRVERDGADGVTIVIAGVVAARPTPPEWVLVPVADGALVRARWVGTWPDAGVGLDPDSGWSDLHTRLVPSADDLVAVAGGAQAWLAMRASGHRALAHELIGIGKRMLAMTVDHVTSREQFGRPLASFQVVKHKLADVRLWQETAELAAEAAWETHGSGESDIPDGVDDEVETARLAKLLAARFVRAARENCQQLLGGMGFTWEHDFHRYLRRSIVLEPLLGGGADLRGELGVAIKARGAMSGVSGL